MLAQARADPADVRPKSKGRPNGSQNAVPKMIKDALLELGRRSDIRAGINAGYGPRQSRLPAAAGT